MRWRSSGLSLLSQGNYAGAEAKFQLALGAARAVGDLDSEGRAYSAFGSVELTLHRYRKSLDAFLQAARLLRQSSDQVGSALVKANIGSLYGEMGDVDRAAQWVEEAMHELPPADLAAHLSQMQIQLAILRAQEKDGMPAATALFWAAIEGAYRAKDWDTYGKAWNRLGDAYLKRGDLFGERRLAEAEKPLEEALKVRLQKHLP